MRLALCLSLLACLFGASAASAATPAPAWLTKARMTGCETALTQPHRQATFSGDMKTVPGALRLQVKFVLETKIEGEPGWTDVDAPGFGSWNTSAAGIGRFVYTKTVENLPAPAQYRTQVSFRWLSAAGKPIQRAHRVSRICREPDLRPDLVPLTLEPLGDGYALTVANEGRTDASLFVVTIEVGGRTTEFAQVQELAAGERRRVFGPAPECAPGDRMIVRVDTEAGVEEADEELNELAVACPARRRR
jgi:hypothetical protein